jgi:glycosyltransferase involved in cell wall biosynthesis
MDYQPLVSIITIVYNGEKYIEQTINSVLSQSYPHIEYVIIDGGSKDNTIPIIKKYEHRIARWISEKDEGISDAFNKGISLATGEIVGIINADDWYEPDTVEKVVNQIGQADIVFGNIQYWNDTEKSFIQIGTLKHLERDVSITHPTVFVKKSCYDRFGKFNTGYKCAMDYELLIRLKVNNCRFAYIPAVLANMRWQGLSDKKWLAGRRELLAIKRHYFPERKISNYFFYYRNMLAIATVKLLEKLHLGVLLKFYRERFSRLKKTYN